MIDEEFKERINAINNSTSWARVVPGLVKEKGTIDCPFCNRKSRAYLYPNFFKCYSSRCNIKGDKIIIYSKLNNIKYYDSLLSLECSANLDPKSQLKEFDERTKVLYDVLDAYHDQLNKYSNVRKYLNSRGLDNAFIDQMKIGYAPNSNILSTYESINKNKLFRNELATPTYEFFNQRIIFPIHSQSNHLVHLTGRTYPNKNKNKYLDTKAIPVIGSSKKYLLFEEHLSNYIKTSDTLYLVEGVPDSFTLRQLGWPVVGIMGLNGIMNHSTKFQGFKKLVAMFDNDRFEADHPNYPGQYKSWRVVYNQLIELQISYGSSLKIEIFKVPSTYKNTKDINDLYLTLNKEESLLKKVIRNNKINLVKDFILKNRSDISQHKTAIKLVGATNSYKELMRNYMYLEEFDRLDYITKILSY